MEEYKPDCECCAPPKDNGNKYISKEPIDRNEIDSNGEISTGNESSVPCIQHNDFSKKESVAVDRLRLLVFVVILIAAVSISLTVYMITRDGENKEFESQFNGMAEQLTTTFNGIASQKIGVLGGLRVSFISHAIDHNNTWPFVTLPNFQQRAATAKRMSNSIYLGIHPIVDDSERDDWEKYVAQEGFQWM
jgi:hypothetical protein